MPGPARKRGQSDRAMAGSASKRVARVGRIVGNGRSAGGHLVNARTSGNTLPGVFLWG
jgi:hypothetical protein